MWIALPGAAYCVDARDVHVVAKCEAGSSNGREGTA